MPVSAAQAAPAVDKSKPPEKPAPESDDPRWQPVLRLPCQLTVELPIPLFKVSDFLALRTGSVVGTKWNMARDVPLRINGTLIGWGELEGAGNCLAVRLTEIA
jgi:flagellar motor switch/type III secretory pathway protein FliN